MSMDPRSGSYGSGDQPSYGQSWQPPGQSPGGGSFGPSNPYSAGYGQSPYGDPNYGGPPQKPSRLWLWLLLGGGGVLLLVCCGCGGLVMFGLNVIEEEVSAQLEADPVVREHLGEVEKVEFDFMKTAQASEDGDDDTMVFNVEGTKGSGEVTGRTNQGGSEPLTDGVLRLPTGEEYPLGK